MMNDRRWFLPPLPSLMMRYPLLGTANPLSAKMACLLPPLVMCAVQPQVCKGKTIRLRTVACPVIPPLMTPNATKLMLNGMPEVPPTRARKQSRLPRAQTFPRRHRTLKCPYLTRPILCPLRPRTDRTTRCIKSGDLSFSLARQTLTVPPGWPMVSLLRTKLYTLIPSSSGLLVHPIPKAQNELLLATIDTPALAWKLCMAVPMWTMPLVLLVPFVTRPGELRLMQCIVVGKTMRMAPLQAILKLRGGTTWLNASPPARLRQRLLLLLPRGQILPRKVTPFGLLPVLLARIAAGAPLAAIRLRVSIVLTFATRVNTTIKTPPTPSRTQRTTNAPTPWSTKYDPTFGP